MMCNSPYFDGWIFCAVLLIFVFFASIGSFLNVIGYRWVRDQSLIFGRSSCIHCQTVIPWYYLFPIFSYIFLGGSSACCKQPIASLYLMIEVVSGFFFTIHAVYAIFSLQYSLLFYLLPFFSLVLAIRTDLDSMVILTLPTLGLIPFGFLASGMGWIPISLVESLLGALIGYSFLWCMNWIVYLFRSEQGVGEGDMELMALIGSFWGVGSLLYILWIASLLGLFFVFVGFLLKKETIMYMRIPFAPALVSATFVYHFFSMYTAL